MSYSVWSTNGYGVCVTDMNISLEKLINLTKSAPEFHSRLLHTLSCYNIDDTFLSDHDTYSDHDKVSIIEDAFETEDISYAYILSEVITELENISMIYCFNFDDEYYILLDHLYPWQMSGFPRMRNITREEIDDIFVKYLSMVSDSNIIIDYYSVSNGG